MKKIINKIIEARTQEILDLIKEAEQINLIEREIATLAIDVVLSLKKKDMAKFGCNCFRKIDFAITTNLRKKLSEETRGLLNEMIILDEAGKKYGPDFNLIVNLTKKILDREGERFVVQAKETIGIVSAS
ncbi:MAG: hypothetical protein AAB338_01010 [Patescibacteria group bacterium]